MRQRWTRAQRQQRTSAVAAFKGEFQGGVRFASIAAGAIAITSAIYLSDDVSRAVASSSAHPLDKSAEEYMQESLSVVIIGASEIIDEESTYTALYSLYKQELLPPNTKIYGYGKASMSDGKFRSLLAKSLRDQDVVEGVDNSTSLTAFLNLCVYEQQSEASLRGISGKLATEEQKYSETVANRVFYLAVSPEESLEVARDIKEAADDLKTGGWSRVIVEQKAHSSSASLSDCFDNASLYQMNYSLGMEMVQNMLVMRFANSYFEPVWNRNHVAAVYLTYKEAAGSKGEGKNGKDGENDIIRNVIQDQLLQILSLVAMEAPENMHSADALASEKVKLLNAVKPIRPEHVVIGRFEADGDESCATFATVVLYIDNPRWEGVPFIIKAGRGMDQQKVDVRVQLKDAPGAERMFDRKECPRNEIVMRLTPNESVYIRTNLKAPGLSTVPVQSELDLTYRDRYGQAFAKQYPDTYARVLLNVLKGDRSMFLRDDEIARSAEIFEPVCNQVKSGSFEVHPYAFGSRGPKASDTLAIGVGYDASTIQRRLAAGPRDDRPTGGGYTARELKVYIENPSLVEHNLSFDGDHMPDCFA